ncbi:hypothetical protein V2J09_004272 [Rumex salicifolius]
MDTLPSPEEELPLVESALTSKTTQKNHARDIHLLSAAFLLVFLSFGAVQNLQSTINTGKDLGTISLGILYVSFAIFSLISSLVVRAMGPKKALLLGTTGYLLFTAANLMPNWYTMVPTSVYLGFTASIIWVGQGTYLTSTAVAHARHLNLHEGSVIGDFNGEFYGIYATHQVVGNIVSLFLLRDEEVCAPVPMLIFFGGSTSGTTVLFIVFLCIMSIGIVLMCFLHKSHIKGEESPDGSTISFVSSVSSASNMVIKPLSDRRMLLIIPLFAYSGLQQAFVWAEFTKSVAKPALGESGVAFSMAVYGAFDAICSLVGGRLTSNLKSVSMIVAGGCSAQAIILLWILIFYWSVKVFVITTGGILGVLYPLIMAAALGIGDGVLATQLNALLGMLFKNDTVMTLSNVQRNAFYRLTLWNSHALCLIEAAFAQLKLWQSSSIAVVFFLMPYISLHAMTVIMLSVLCFAAAAFFYLTVRIENSFSVFASAM